VHQTVTLMFGNTEQIKSEVTNTGTGFLEKTTGHWQTWARALTVPETWREAVIRAAITLELNVYEETGAIIGSGLGGSGTLIEQITINATRGPDRLTLQDTTDSNGNYSVSFEQGTLSSTAT